MWNAMNFPKNEKWNIGCVGMKRGSRKKIENDNKYVNLQCRYSQLINKIFKVICLS